MNLWISDEIEIKGLKPKTQGIPEISTDSIIITLDFLFSINQLKGRGKYLLLELPTYSG